MEPAQQPGLTMGRSALLAAAAGYAVLVMVQAFTLPDRVPGHVGTSGEVTWWGDRAGHVVVASLTGLGVFLAFWFVPAIIRRAPAEMINIPHKDHWLKPENRPVVERRLGEDLGWMGAATLAFVGFAMWEMGNIARGGQVPGVAFWTVLAVYTIGLTAWAIWMHVGPRYKPPHP